MCRGGTARISIGRRWTAPPHAAAQQARQAAEHVSELQKKLAGAEQAAHEADCAAADEAALARLEASLPAAAVAAATPVGGGVGQLMRTRRSCFPAGAEASAFGSAFPAAVPAPATPVVAAPAAPSSGELLLVAPTVPDDLEMQAAPLGGTPTRVDFAPVRT